MLRLRLNHFFQRNKRLFSFHRASPVVSGSTIGKLYEQKCQKVVSEAFDTPVAIVGGANDGGIDLRWAKVLKFGSQIDFIGQCKFRDGKKVQPDVVRALEGSLSAHPPKTIGVLITNRRPTNESLNRLNDSVFPMIYLRVQENECCKHIYEVMMNRKINNILPNLAVVESRSLNSGIFFKFKFN